MGLLTVSLALGVRFGNGLILAVIAQLKSFRTVPNILVANIAVVDMLNAVINTPIYMISSLLQAVGSQDRVWRSSAAFLIDYLSY